MSTENRGAVRPGDQDQRFIYTTHYPKSLTQIPLLRMISCNGEAWIVEVLDVVKKRGRVIADCKPGIGTYGPYFSCYPEHVGHLDLCRHLLSCGVGGYYKRYLNAVEKGEDALVNELAGMAMIRFSIRLSQDEYDSWDIDMCSFVKFKDKVEDDAEQNPDSEPTEHSKEEVEEDFDMVAEFRKAASEEIKEVEK